jgi:hypothetical protein
MARSSADACDLDVSEVDPRIFLNLVVISPNSSYLPNIGNTIPTL